MENQDFVTAPQKYGTANGGYATRNEYDFVENQDFVSFTENPVKIQRGRPSKEYQISLDMANFPSPKLRSAIIPLTFVPCANS